MARRITSNTFVTLDGVMQGPGGPDEDRDGGFTHGGWSVGYFDEGVGNAVDQWMNKFSPNGDLLLGRKTYEIFANYWPSEQIDEADRDIANPLNDATKYVVSESLSSLSWGPSVLINGDVVGRLTEIKSGDGPDLQVHGSSVLLQTLLKHGLIDFMQVIIMPCVLGTGKKLFGDGIAPTGMKVVEIETTPGGVVIARYEPGEAIPYGQMGF
ncbi:MAG: dihydrofolate reductase family protein [Thermomicrobiales bacterium]